MKRLIIVGSPRSSGRSAHLAEMLFEANIAERPEDELFLVPISEVDVGPCIGCNACREKSGVILKGDDGKEVTVQRHRCVFDDDMQALYDLIDDADELSVVSPVYFSGAPAQTKCLLDRLQPYFWANARKGTSGHDSLPIDPKRPATLHVVGEGGDPHGYGALVSEVKSALAIAGFRLERLFDWVGKIDEEGEITAEADEVELASARSDQGLPAVPPDSADGEEGELEALPTTRAPHRESGSPNRSELRFAADSGQSGGGRVAATSSSAATSRAQRSSKSQDRPKLRLNSGSGQPARARGGASASTSASASASAKSAPASRKGGSGKSSKNGVKANRKQAASGKGGGSARKGSAKGSSGAKRQQKKGGHRG